MRFFVVASPLPLFMAITISLTSALALAARSSSRHETFFFAQVTSFHHDSGFPPRRPFQRLSPNGSGGGQPHLGSLAKYLSHCSITSSGHAGRYFLISSTEIMLV